VLTWTTKLVSTNMTLINEHIEKLDAIKKIQEDLVERFLERGNDNFATMLKDIMEVDQKVE